MPSSPPALRPTRPALVSPAQDQSRAVSRVIGPRAEPISVGRDLEHLGRSGRALLAATYCRMEGGCVGHIQKRADRRYRARWLDPDGRERSRTFTRRADAERHLAAVEGAIASSPVTRLSLPRSENARIVPLTVAQVQALANAMPDRCRAMIIIQAGLGLRIAELLGTPRRCGLPAPYCAGGVAAHPRWQAPRITQNAQITPHGAIAHRGRRNPCGAHLGIRTG